jgi:hypothetical protein
MKRIIVLINAILSCSIVNNNIKTHLDYEVVIQSGKSCNSNGLLQIKPNSCLLAIDVIFFQISIIIS